MENKRFLTNELYIDIRNSYTANDYIIGEDNCIIGFLNSNKTKIKDIVTGEIRDFSNCPKLPLSEIFENYMALDYMTNCKTANASAYQKVLAQIILALTRKKSITINGIKTIKNIMNTQISETIHKEEKEKQRIEKRNVKLNQYKIDDSERNF